MVSDDLQPPFSESPRMRPTASTRFEKPSNATSFDRYSRFGAHSVEASVTLTHTERRGKAASGSWKLRDIDWKFCIRAQHYGTAFFGLFIIIALGLIHWTVKPASRPFCKQPDASSNPKSALCSKPIRKSACHKTVHSTVLSCAQVPIVAPVHCNLHSGTNACTISACRAVCTNEMCRDSCRLCSAELIVLQLHCRQVADMFLFHAVLYDASISNMSGGDTVPAAAAILVPFILLCISLFAFELGIYRLENWHITNGVATVMHFLLDSICAFATVACFTEATKMAAGRLRPDFFQQCKPNIDWQSGTAMLGVTVDAVCTTGDIDGRKSFCSGHASTSAVLVAYNICYLIWAGHALTHILCRHRLSASHCCRICTV